MPYDAVEGIEQLIDITELFAIEYDTAGNASWEYQSLKDGLMLKDIYNEEFVYFFRYLEALFFRVDKEKLVIERSSEYVKDRKKRIEESFTKIANKG